MKPPAQTLHQILQIAIPSPLNQTFDYLLPPPKDQDQTQALPGMRVRVPFGKSIKIGIIIEISKHPRIASKKLRAALEIIDEQAIIPDDLMTLLDWASRYYHHAPGNVFSAALPTRLRQGQPASKKMQAFWQLTTAGQNIDASEIKRAPRQQAIVDILKNNNGLCNNQHFSTLPPWRPAMRSLCEKGWVVKVDGPAIAETPSSYQPLESPLKLNHEQQSAVDAVRGAPNEFSAFLLEGITGSGKTEVYFHLIQDILSAGQQVLVLVPEIGLTPQLVERFEKRFKSKLAIMHSGLSEQQRLDAWLSASSGEADIIIGTRSAVFSPCPRLGMIIIDEEHDLSFKQQDGFRYHARDVAIMRARQTNIPIMLGSATPSLESLQNAHQQRFQRLQLKKRIGTATPPTIRFVDIRHQQLTDGLSGPLLQAIEEHLSRQQQVLLFLNRRGYAPTLLCHDCGWVARCQRCDSHLIYHQQRKVLRCHHCDAQRPLDSECADCHSKELRAIGHGTQRIEETLQQRFSDCEIIRIDRDSTRRKGSFQAFLDRVKNGQRQILLGTQMLAKGHHLPNVTLVGILDADQGLYSVDFRASERMGQLIIQVAGRAGRADKQGEVLIQTHHPDHQLLHYLKAHDYPQFSAHLIEERQAAQLPPFSHFAILRAEAVKQQQPLNFLDAARQQAEQFNTADTLLLGPVPAVMERRAGRYRAQLLIQSSQRKALHQLLYQWLPTLTSLQQSRQVRWSLDIDPQEIL